MKEKMTTDEASKTLQSLHEKVKFKDLTKSYAKIPTEKLSETDIANATEALEHFGIQAKNMTNHGYIGFQNYSRELTNALNA